MDGNGVNSGLQKFKKKMKKAKIRRYNPIPPKCDVKFDDFKSNTECDTRKNKDDVINDKSISNANSSVNLHNLKLYLLQKVESCLKNHGADDVIGTDIKNLFDDELVDVVTAGDRIYGNITCLICKHQNKKNNSKKKVSYYQSTDKNYWVMSNFTKHLTNFHQLSSNRSTNQIIIMPKNDVELNKIVSNNFNNNDDDSVFIVEEVSVEMIPTKIDYVANINIDESSLYNQLAQQIGDMIGTVLLNNDPQEQMQFYHNENEKDQLTVAKIQSDGNCLFGAIVHQIWQHEIDSAEHDTATKQLRKNVIDYILKSDNFESFQFMLQDRVYERNNEQKSKILNIKDECKNYVQYVLSREGEWGGYETIIAASRIHSTNIIIIDEVGSYYISSDTNRMYDRSIVLAYRMGAKNIRNHYDSVCDIESTSMYKITNVITKRLKGI